MTTLSIITVVRNDASGLKLTAESIFDQIEHCHEWIILDGASTDNTTEVIKSLEINRLKWRSEADEGIFDAMNKAVLMAEGSHFIFMNAGDEFTAGAVKVFREAISLDKDAIWFSAWESVSADGASSVLRPRPELLPSRMSVCHQACVIPRAIFSRIGGYNSRVRLASDYDFFLRAALLSVPMKSIDDVLVRYYRGGASDHQLVRARAEVIKSLWKNQSPDRVKGTVIYVKQILFHLVGPRWTERLVRLKKVFVGQANLT